MEGAVGGIVAKVFAQHQRPVLGIEGQGEERNATCVKKRKKKESEEKKNEKSLTSNFSEFKIVKVKRIRADELVSRVSITRRLAKDVPSGQLL